MERHIYSFENICREDKTITLGDAASRIFLNTDGRLDDVSKELKAFLDYVAGHTPDDSYVRRLDEAVKEAKKNREWRHEYMTLLMRDQENIERGIEKGIEKGKIYGAISAYQDLELSNEQIIQKLQEKYHLSWEDTNEYLQLEMV